MNFSTADQADFSDAWDRFDDRVRAAGGDARDRPAADFLEPGGRWNALLDALSTYINGVELDRLSVQDFSRYRNTCVNWRSARGYGALIEAYAAPLDVRLNSPATLIDHAGPRVRVTTRKRSLSKICAAIVSRFESSLV